MANKGDIFIEADFDNIFAIDPNKIYDEFGNVQQRLVNHEELVMYVNLECNLLPRTKLQIGVGAQERNVTIATNKINFLNPGDKGSLDTTWTDNFTKTSNLKGDNLKNSKPGASNIPSQNANFEQNQSKIIDGAQDTSDTALLGITAINYKINSSFLPEVNMVLEDIRGRALFESGDQSPYSVFFQMPYPLFYLTMKGWYGKATRVPLQLMSFNASFNTNSGNFIITLNFYGYRYSMISEIPSGALVALPHMFEKKYGVKPIDNQGSDKQVVENITTTRGVEALKNVYSKYKAKGLIDDNFPEYTVVEFINKLDQFQNNISKTLNQEDYDRLTQIQQYKVYLESLQSDLIDRKSTTNPSWLDKYSSSGEVKTIATKIKKNDVSIGNVIAYNLSDEKANILQTHTNAKQDLNKLLLEYKKKFDFLSEFKDVVFNIEADDFYVDQNPNANDTDVDWNKTYFDNTGVSSNGATDPLFIDFVLGATKLINTYNKPGQVAKSPNNGQVNLNDAEVYFINLFNYYEKLRKIKDAYDIKSQEIKKEIAENIRKLFSDKVKGLGFDPVIRNVTAILYASVEAFIYLMDETHTLSWNVRNDTQRKKIVNSTESVVDKLTNNNDPIYPWPQTVKKENVDGGELYTLYYPGDNPECRDAAVWPEVEFVEEFVKGLTQRTNVINSSSISNQNQQNETGLVSINTLDYPISSIIYLNKEEAKFIYEIWERCYTLAFYTRLSKTNDGTLYAPISEYEVNNILISLRGSSLGLKQLLSKYSITSQNITQILRQISNNGLGQSWQLFIRELFNTDYIVSNISQDVTYVSYESLKNVNFTSTTENNIPVFLKNTKTNSPDFFDTFPFTTESWVKNNLANGITTNLDLANNTNRTIFFNKEIKSLTNFEVALQTTNVRPYLNFDFNRVFLGESSTFSLKDFYNSRSPKDYVPCEGYLRYSDDIGLLTKQLIGPSKQLIQKSTSIFNTPIFVNSIITSVAKFRNNNFYPNVVPAYLFLNSLPLATLREKMKTKNGSSVSDLDYVFSTLKKFSAIHELPYSWILKYGSIWHRYKVWTETNVDILTNDWSDFQYVENYDPSTVDKTKHYNINILEPNGNPQSVDIVLEQNTLVGNITQSVVNLGFYPNLYDDFNVFYQGTEVIKSGFTYGYPNNLIDNSISSKSLILYKSDPTGSNRTQIQNPIFRNIGFDPSNINRTLSINTWSALSTKLTASTQTEECFILPSFGNLYNETIEECFKQGVVSSLRFNLMQTEIMGNKSMYNGSVRLMWGAPNYGYFNLTGLTKPTPEEYMKEIFSGTSEQSNFGFQKTGYSKISDIFGTFDISILDFFEQEFLQFSKSVYDVNSSNDLRNFQALFRSIMTIQKPEGTSYDSLIQDAISKQNTAAYTKISQFLTETVLLRIANPSGFDRQIFLSFSNTSSANPNSPVIEDRYEYFPYQGNLPPETTLVASLSNSPSAWVALKTYVGFSEISGLVYSDGGSYITDFFRDLNVEFTENNAKNLAPLIKIYATRKLLDPTLNQTKFTQDFKNAILEVDKFKNGIIDALFTNKKLLEELNGVGQIQESNKIDVNKEIDSPTIKVEIWELFKAINDKWIAGGDFDSKTFFEDVLFLDRASRDVGKDIIVDIPNLLSVLKGSFISSEKGVFGSFDKKNLRDIINSIIIKNNFVIMPISGFMNFFGVQSPLKNAKPKVEDPLSLSNGLFGTFLEVDVRDSASKMVCYYANKASEHLKLNEKTSFFKNDTWNFNLPNDNPLRNNPTENFGLQNKVIGFVVDVGIQNQNVFYDINLNQTPGKPTSETIQALTDLANQGSGRGASTASVSLYNVYKTRSYSCEITMFGNVMIQPMMYFILRHVPMFEGPYLIIDVSHDIRPGQFTTKVTGVRQPIPVLNNPSKQEAILRIQSAYLDQIEKEIYTNLKNNKPIIPNDVPSPTTQGTNNFIIDAFLDTKRPQFGDCSETLYGLAQKFTLQDTIRTTTTVSELKDLINGATSNNDVKKLVFSLIWLESTDGVNNEIKSFNNNLIGLPLNIQNIDNYISNYKGKILDQYVCVSIGDSSYAMACFDTMRSSIELACSKFQPLVVGANVNLDQEKVTNLLIENWPIKAPTATPTPDGTNGQTVPTGSQTIKSTNPSEYNRILDKVKKAFYQANAVNLFPNT